MLKLPFEILEKVFSYLEEKDLVQCQLTSKIWYQSSVEHLYSKPLIYTYQKTRLYIRTISNSLQLGSYLHHINVTLLLHAAGEGDKPYLLNILFRNCPNITLITSSISLDEPLWDCITQAASQGQLSRLQVLPVSSSFNLPLYIRTVLLFKDSLASINIRDDHLYEVGNDLTSIDDYQTLLDQISEFKKLRNFEINYRSKKQLSDFDALINDCHHLKELKIHLVFPDPPYVIIEPETRIHARPDIISLDCFWRMIDNESQLRYITQKFPNLQRLRVEYAYYEKFVPLRCPCNAILEFLLHAINKIPKFEIELEVERKNLAFVWEKLVETKPEYQNITVSCGFEYGVILKSTHYSLEITFPIDVEDKDFTQIDFFNLAGKSTRLLKIPDISTTNYTPYSPISVWNRSKNIDWLFKTLEFFTSLETLILTVFNTELSSSGLLCQNKSIKTLYLTDITNYKVSIKFLKYMSLNLPNIKHLHLSFYHAPTTNWPIVITMQDTYLELLKWTVKPYYNNGVNQIDQIYIRLDTKSGVEFYKSDELFLSRITEQYYNNNSANKLCFEITCQNLKKFTIGLERRPIQYNWYFPISNQKHSYM